MKKIACVAIAALALSATALPASAVYWYSSSKPLTAYKGSIAAAQGYGNFYNDQGSFAHNTSSQKDPYANGNAVYVQNQFFFHKYSADCSAGGGVCWVFSVNKQTDRTSSSSYSATYRSRTLESSGDGARDVITVYEDKPYAVDPASAPVIISFNY